MPHIFISYRRADSLPYAARIRDHLLQHFDKSEVFMDINDIPIGQPFPTILEGALESCDALLAIIGRQWLDSRLNNPEDFVRKEIEAALYRKILVIPVLVGKASIPQPGELPDSLRPLTLLQALEVSDSRFEYDVNKLIGALEQVVQVKSDNNIHISIIMFYKSGQGIRYNSIQDFGLNTNVSDQVFSILPLVIEQFDKVVVSAKFRAFWLGEDFWIEEPRSPISRRDSNCVLVCVEETLSDRGVNYYTHIINTIPQLKSISTGKSKQIP